MKTKHIFLPLLALCILLSACEKYLDIKRTSGQANVETINDCQLLLDNYTVFNTNYPTDNDIAADDFFLNDLNYNNPDRVSLEDKNIYSYNPAFGRIGGGSWMELYNKVYYSNIVLETLEKLNGKEAADAVNNLRGAALFLRAYQFWNLAQLYAKPYDAATLQEPGIPLRLNSDINIMVGRGTVQQTYAKIVSDLQEAVTLMPATSVKPTRPNKAAAYAMLARVYLSMEDYPNALISASAALDINSTLMDYNTVNSNTTNPFYPRFNTEVIFHSVTSLATILNPGSTGDAVARISPELYNLYEPKDLRKLIFFKPNTINYSYMENGQQKGIDVPDGTYRFSGNYEQGTNSIQFNGLAVDELLLIAAEGYARANNVEKALEKLNALLIKRYENTSTSPFVPKTAATPLDALKLVLEHRRKELVMRRLRWTDLRRLDKDSRFAKPVVKEVREIRVQGSNASDYTVTNTVKQSFTLNIHDPRYTLLIPQSAVESTPNLPQNLR